MFNLEHCLISTFPTFPFTFPWNHRGAQNDMCRETTIFRMAEIGRLGRISNMLARVILKTVRDLVNRRNTNSNSKENDRRNNKKIR